MRLLASASFAALAVAIAAGTTGASAARVAGPGFVGPRIAHPSIPPDFALRDQNGRAVRLSAQRGKVVLLTAPDVRRALRRLIEGAFPEVAVLTYGELDVELQIRPLGRLAPVSLAA